MILHIVINVVFIYRFVYVYYEGVNTRGPQPPAGEPIIPPTRGGFPAGWPGGVCTPPSPVSPRAGSTHT